MSGLVIKITGLEETIKYLDEVGVQKIPRAIQVGLERGADYVLNILNRNTPVDTGKLRSSNRKVVNLGLAQAKIGPDPTIAPYATWVEHGHHLRNGNFLSGQFFILRTANTSRRGVQEIFDNAMKVAIS